MDDAIFQRLNQLQHGIDNKEFIEAAVRVSEWGGADVIISNRETDRIKKWLGESRLVISLQNTEPRRRAVITQFSKELSWLFYQLRDAFSGSIDYVSKYDFYGRLAQAAIDYVEEHKDDTDCTLLLQAVLDEARKLINNESPR